MDWSKFNPDYVAWAREHAATVEAANLDILPSDVQAEHLRRIALENPLFYDLVVHALEQGINHDDSDQEPQCAGERPSMPDEPIDTSLGASYA